ncbi:hypothetical protein [Streptomyces sp. BK79]|uniref:hypothetical protein n=1 Tax=Streptomyces sp. BK79 TaxID=3350097 RepID=UPI00376F8BDB
MTRIQFAWSVVVCFLLSAVVGLVAGFIRKGLGGKTAEVWVWGATSFTTCMTLCLAVAMLYAAVSHPKGEDRHRR